MKRILVAEDEAAIREFVVINLKRAGYEVWEAENGQEALDLFDQQNGDFDIALLDVMMPILDGFAVCRELRKRSQNIGIIMLTARTLGHLHSLPPQSPVILQFPIEKRSNRKTALGEE